MRPRIALVLTATALVTAAAAHADETFWLAPSDGSLNDPARWSAGVPTTVSTARFGEIPSSRPFVLTSTEELWSLVMVVREQSPIFALSPSLPIGYLVTGPTIIAGPDSPTLTVRSGVLQSNGDVQIGKVELGGPGLALVEAGGTWRIARLQVGLGAGSVGTMRVASGGSVAVLDGIFPWSIGQGGTGEVVVESGATWTFPAPSTTTVGAAGGQGLLDIAGATVTLPGSTMVIAGPSGAQTTGTVKVRDGGAIVGGGTIRVGQVGTAELRGTNATIAPAIIVGDSGSGSGSLFLEGGVTSGAISTGDAAHSIVVVGPERDAGERTMVSTPSLSIGKGTGLATVTVRHRATVETGLIWLANKGQTELSIESGAAVHGSSTLAVGSSSSAGAPSLAISVAGAGSALVVDGDWSSSRSMPITLAVSNGATCSIGGSMGFAKGAFLDLAIRDGARMTVGGACSLVHGSGPIIVGTCALDGGSLSCAAFASDVGVATTLVLGPQTLSDGPPLVASGAVTFAGALTIALAEGFVPPAGTFIPAVSAASIAYDPLLFVPPIQPMAPLALVERAGSLGFLVLEPVDSMTTDAPAEAERGIAAHWATTAMVDGVALDVSATTEWTFDPPIVQRISGDLFVPIALGVTEATARFGGAELHRCITVRETDRVTFSLASGKNLAWGIQWGDGESGDDGPSAPTGVLGVGGRSLSGDGSVVAFASTAWNLAMDIGPSGPINDLPGTRDVLVRDERGLTMASVPNGPGSVTGGSRPSMSRDGRFIVFVSDDALSLALTDRSTGICQSLLTLTTNGIGPDVRVSDDGRFIAFGTASATLVAGDTNGVSDVFLLDRELGSTTRVSLSAAGGQLSVPSTLMDMTTDGRFVFFRRVTTGWPLVHRYDRLTGNVDLVTPGIAQPIPPVTVQRARASDDGRFLAFVAAGFGVLVEGMPVSPMAQAYRRDLLTGETLPVSVSGDGLWATAPIEGLAISGDGRSVAFTTVAANLPEPGSPGAGLGNARLFRHDCLNGRTELLSVHGGPASGGGSDDVPFSDAVLPELAMSIDGLHIAFASRADDVYPGDTLGYVDTFVAHVPAARNGDLDGDGAVGAADLSILLAAWGTAEIDLDGDGVAGAGDVALLLGWWSHT